MVHNIVHNIDQSNSEEHDQPHVTNVKLYDNDNDKEN